MKITDSTSVTATQIGQLFWVSKQAASRWPGRGCPRNKDGSFDLSATIRWHLEAKDKKAARIVIPPSKHLERLRSARADREEYNRDLENGKLILKQDHQRKMTTWSRYIRSLLDQLPRRMAVDLSTVSKPVQIMHLLEQEVQRICKEASESTEKDMARFRPK